MINPLITSGKTSAPSTSPTASYLTAIQNSPTIILPFFLRSFGNQVTGTSDLFTLEASWKEMILMCRLCDFIRRIFRLSRSVGRVDFKVEELAKEPAKEPVKEPVKETVDLQDYSNPFLNLPNELLLAVAHFLDKEFQALLSLSCTRLRLLLNSYLDLSLNDISVKLRFLRYLERDYPDHLICRSCGFLFN